MKRSNALILIILLTCLPGAFSFGQQGKSRKVIKSLSLPPAQTIFSSAEVVVPMYGTPSQPIIKIYINNKGPFDFILDTGMDRIVLGDHLANDLGLPLMADLQESDIRSVERIQLGGLEFRDVMAESKVLDREVDGFLGFNLFQETVFTINVLQKRFKFSKNSLDDPDGIEILKYRFKKKDCPYITIRTENKKIPFLLSSGMVNYVQIEASGISQFNFKFPPQEVESTASFPLHEGITAGRVTDNLYIGHNLVLEPILTISREGEYMIGNGILQHYLVTFDPMNKLVRVYTNNEVPLVIPSVREMGFSVEKVENGWGITEVKSWMDDLGIDIRQGDVITHVDFEPSAGLTLFDWTELERNQNYVSLIIERGEASFDIEVPVKIILP